jgi:hypothetical protein
MYRCFLEAMDKPFEANLLFYVIFMFSIIFYGTCIRLIINDRALCARICRFRFSFADFVFGFLNDREDYVDIPQQFIYTGSAVEKKLNL